MAQIGLNVRHNGTDNRIGTPRAKLIVFASILSLSLEFNVQYPDGTLFGDLNWATKFFPLNVLFPHKISPPIAGLLQTD